MSAIFASLVRHEDTGVREDSQKLLIRSRSKTHDAVGLGIHYPSEFVRKVFRGKRMPELAKIMDTGGVSYGFLGCAYSKPAIAEHEEVPPFCSDHDTWTLVIDGATEKSPQQIVDEIAKNGWERTVPRLKGQFALIAYNRRESDYLYWATKAKPLFVLKGASDNWLRIAGNKEDLLGFYHPIRSPQPVELGPYQWGYVTRHGLAQRNPYEMTYGSGSLVLCGGGLDSAVAAWDNQHTYMFEDTILLNVNYGQLAKEREWVATQSLARELQRSYPSRSVTATRATVDFFRRYTQTPLLGDGKVATTPHPGKATEWVPARNTVLMALGLSFAESNGLARIVTGINADAASAYPDNELEWLKKWQELTPYALGNDRSIELEAPLGKLTKTEIARLGDRLLMPWDSLYTWSCYKGDRYHCGKCSSCRSRRAAFKSANLFDYTKYEVNA